MQPNRRPGTFPRVTVNEEIVEPWRKLLRAQKAVLDHLADEMEAEAGLPLGWYEVLLHLQESPTGRLRMHEIADSLLLSRSAEELDRPLQAKLVQYALCCDRGSYHYCGVGIVPFSVPGRPLDHRLPAVSDSSRLRTAWDSVKLRVHCYDWFARTIGGHDRCREALNRVDPKAFL